MRLQGSGKSGTGEIREISVNVGNLCGVPVVVVVFLPFLKNENNTRNVA